MERSRVRIHLRIRCSVLSVRRRKGLSCASSCRNTHLEQATSAWWGLTLGMSWDERGPLFSVVNIFLRSAKSMSLKIILTRLHYGTCGSVLVACPTGSVAVSRVFRRHLSDQLLFLQQSHFLSSTFLSKQVSNQPRPLRLLGVSGMEEV